MLFRITIYYKNGNVYPGGVYCKEIFVNPYKRLLVQEKKNSYIIGIGDNKNNFEEILYDIKKKDVRKEKAFDVERLSDYLNDLCIRRVNLLIKEINKE